MTVLRDCVYKSKIREVPELNLVAHHISKRIELMRDQKKEKKKRKKKPD